MPIHPEDTPKTAADELPKAILAPPVMELNSAEPPLASAITAGPTPRPRGKKRVADQVAGGLWNWVLPILTVTAFFLIAFFGVIHLLQYWRLLNDQADAEALFMRRRAELKAEAEHADERLDLLDKRVHLASLGFREVARKAAPHVVNVANYAEPKPAELKVLEKRKGLVTYDPDNDKKYVLVGLGSGLIVKPGVILTNHHVIKGAERVRISFASGQSIGVDPEAITTLTGGEA